MLVLDRKIGEEIVIGDDIVVRVLDVNYPRTRLGITAPREISVHRREVYDDINNELNSGTE